MTEGESFFFENLINRIEQERILWEKLHKRLDDLLTEVGVLGGDNAWNRKTHQGFIPGIFGNWRIIVQDAYFEFKPERATPESLSEYSERDLDSIRQYSKEHRPTNRWGEDMYDAIEISLWLADDGRDYFHTMSDDPKLQLICSPRGVIYEETGEHMSVEEVALLYEDSIFDPTKAIPYDMWT